jgi:uncharacterized protein (DUF433 family)
MAQVAVELGESATEHPHVVRVPGIRGGRPHVRGTGLTVALLARYYQLGLSADDLLAMYPQLTPAGLYDALSYYHDHKPEIDRFLNETDSLEKVKHAYGFTLDSRGRVIWSAGRAG